MSNYKQQVIDIIVDKLGVREVEVTEEKTFGELGADSLDVVELVLEFENIFNIKISDGDAENIKTVGEAIESVQSKMQEKTTANG